MAQHQQHSAFYRMPIFTCRCKPGRQHQIADGPLEQARRFGVDYYGIHNLPCAIYADPQPDTANSIIGQTQWHQRRRIVIQLTRKVVTGIKAIGTISPCGRSASGSQRAWLRRNHRSLRSYDNGLYCPRCFRHNRRRRFDLNLNTIPEFQPYL